MIREENSKGFSLLELMVALALFGVVASFAVPHYMIYIETARATACMVERGQTNRMIIAYISDHQGTEFTSLSQLVTNGGAEEIPNCPHGGQWVLIPSGQNSGAPAVGCSLHFWPETDGEPGDDEITMEEQLDGIARDILAQGVLDGASRAYGKSGQNPDSWSVRLEKFLEDGNPGSNLYGYSNPAAPPDHEYDGQVVLNWNTLGLPKVYWNPAVFITNHPVYGSYDFSEDHSYYPRLQGTMVFSKPDNKASQISYFYIDANGVKGDLNYIEIP